MSGGQMQRVAIARALINNPDIILADAPTGALASETSVQIMEILKEISKDKLIIMVTHNPDIANTYATRIVSCLDGEIVGDTNPFDPVLEDFRREKQKAEAEKAKGKKPSMSMKMAFDLSLKNLFTKKARTILTVFAGSIGIIGIALVLALSNGINGFIDKIESDALLMFPMSIEKEAVNTDSMLETAMGLNPLAEVDHDRDAVYINGTISTLLNTFVQQSGTNNLKSFKKYVDDNRDKFDELCNSVRYKYNTALNIYRTDIENKFIQVSPNSVLDELNLDTFGAALDFVDLNSYANLWQPIVGDNETIKEHYTLIHGKLPEKFNEVVLILDGNNEVTEIMLYALGLKDLKNFLPDIMGAMGGNEVDMGEKDKFTYEEILDLEYKLVLSSDYMVKDKKTGLWSDMRNNNVYVNKLLKKATDLKIVGVIRPNDDNVLAVGTGCIGFTQELIDYIIKGNAESQVVREQLTHPERDVISGEKFMTMTVNDFDLVDIDLNDINYDYLDITPFLSMAENMDLSQIDIMDLSSLFDFSDMTAFQKKLMEGYLTDEQVLAFKQAYIDTKNEKCSMEKTFEAIGYCDVDNPTSIALYPKDFETKAEVNAMIDYYNEAVTNEGHEELTIRATDYIGIVMGIATQAINIVTYTLVIFVAISLVVSSIMIGIITYVSVIERTKEIGILRSIGASKRDISNVFNAETIIIGLAAGIFGIVSTWLLSIPISLLLQELTGAAVQAVLKLSNASILVSISVFLTFIAGLVPSSIAAKKDPVEALRSE